MVWLVVMLALHSGLPHVRNHRYPRLLRNAREETTFSTPSSMPPKAHTAHANKPGSARRADTAIPPSAMLLSSLSRSLFIDHLLSHQLKARPSQPILSCTTPSSTSRCGMILHLHRLGRFCFLMNQHANARTLTLVTTCAASWKRTTQPLIIEVSLTHNTSS